ncbi:hypothetical protein C5S31_02720 [ANME-1 cluster archaeon GoMg2]|nr:hypothetical protein [ANME-1 cluster archaeon GoMg2]
MKESGIEFIGMPLEKEGDWEVVKGKYGTPEVCPWCGGAIEERLIEISYLFS